MADGKQVPVGFRTDGENVVLRFGEYGLTMDVNSAIHFRDELQKHILALCAKSPLRQVTAEEDDGDGN